MPQVGGEIELLGGEVEKADEGLEDPEEGLDDGEGTAPDLQEPFVKEGGGAPKGLSPFEHVEWAKTLTHPFAVLSPGIPG